MSVFVADDCECAAGDLVMVEEALCDSELEVCSVLAGTGAATEAVELSSLDCVTGAGVCVAGAAAGVCPA